MMTKDDWLGLYGEGWQSEIVPDAFQHPAKFSRALIRHIYDHAFLEGWLKAGDRVLDCFGGVALGALDAMRLGLHFTGVELESKFVDLGNKNIELWLRRYAPHFPGWGTARLVQGDSCQLMQIIGQGYASGQAEAVISSPPFVGGGHHNGIFDTWGGEIGKTDSTSWKLLAKKDGGYGDTQGQLEQMRATSAGYELAVSSPPYADAINQHGEGPQGAGDRHGRISPTENAAKNIGLAYGSTPGQLGAMPARGFEAAVSSPPYEGTPVPEMTTKRFGDSPDKTLTEQRNIGYGITDGNIGVTSGSDFWTAARAIVDQVYGALLPGGHAIWVVKDYVKDKQRVPFSEQWAAMCEAAGFELLHRHKAWLIEDRGTQIDLWGNGHNKQVERKSFFRRLAEKKGSPRIDFESVLCMRKR